MYQFQVITMVPPVDEDGNLAMAFTPLIEQIEQPRESNDYKGKYRKVDFGLAFLNLRQPVFQLGEIVIVNSDGREVICDGRKASKWFVEYEEFDNIEDAIRRSQEVTNA
jgi:hypothetical protein